MLYNSMPATTALASRASEMHITAELGYRWSKKADGSRYLAAVDEDLVLQFSKRATAIEERLEQWAEKFERDAGRAPTPRERDRQHTNIQRRTRAAKPDVMEPRPEAIEKWDGEIESSLTETTRALEAEAAEWATEKRRRGYQDDVIDHQVVLDEAIDRLVSTRTKFTRWHLLGEIDKAMPANLPSDLSFAAYKQLTLDLVKRGVNLLGVEALTPVGVIDRNVPVELATPKGRSVFSPPSDEVFASVETLNNEAYLLDRASHETAPGVDAASGDARVSAAGLHGDQAVAMRSVLTSKRSLEVLVGPAGTGKSYTVAKLAEAWKQEGLGDVIGLAKSNAAAAVLRSEGLDSSWNCDRWLMAQVRIAGGRPRRGDAAMKLRPGTLVIVDEASMAETETLVRIVKAVEAVGGKVLLTGDHRQLSSVGAGGFFELAAEDLTLRSAGGVTELRDVRRFENAWEREASLRLRDGDAAVLDLYDRHGRILEAPEDNALELTCELWVTDHLEGKEALVVVATAEEASLASMKIRRELIDLGQVDDSRALPISNGGLVSVGDVVQARENNAQITDAKGEALSNRDRLEVVELTRSGGLVARRLNNGRTVVLDKAYVANNVELSYALTAHGAQGRTVDSSYTVASESDDLASLYVRMTRGRSTNVVLVNTGAGDDHQDHSSTRDAISVLADVVGRASAPQSATAERNAQIEASKSLARLGPAWSAAVAAHQEKIERPAVAEVLGHS